MFDLEGIPARQGCAERVYLWGLSLMQPDHPEQNLQTFSPDLSRKADQQAWFTFLAKAGDLFAAHGDLPFVHWGNYEPQSLRLYVRRHGDRDGIARRIEHNPLDFWERRKATVLIPLT